MPSGKKRRLTFALVLAYFPLSLAYLTFSGQLAARDWRTASREPAGLAPDPATTPEAVVQVYSARAVSWRGWFGVHSWIAVKPSNASEFTVHEVMGWRLEAHRHGAGGAQPAGRRLLVRQPARVVRRHPRSGRRCHHRAHRSGREGLSLSGQATTCGPAPTPTPSSRSSCAECRSCAWTCRPRPSARTILGWRSVGATPSGTGGQANLFGVLGVSAGLEEGLEVNLLGLNFGVDPKSLSIKLPIVGQAGPERPARAQDHPGGRRLPSARGAQSPPQPPPQPPSSTGIAAAGTETIGARRRSSESVKSSAQFARARRRHHRSCLRCACACNAGRRRSRSGCRACDPARTAAAVASPCAGLMFSSRQLNHQTRRRPSLSAFTAPIFTAGVWCRN